MCFLIPLRKFKLMNLKDDFFQGNRKMKQQHIIYDQIETHIKPYLVSI